MHDSKLLSAILDSRQAYEAISGYVVPEELTPQIGMWWKLVDLWYSRDHTTPAVDREILKAKGRRDFPTKHVDSLIETLDGLPDAISPGNVVTEALELKLYNAEMQLAAVIGGRGDKAKVSELLAEVQRLHAATTLATSRVIKAGSLDELDKIYAKENLIKVAPKILNDRLGGGVIPGDHIVVFGRLEIGKTLFMINMVAGFLRQKLPTLYIGNEDPLAKIQYRLRSNLSNMSRETIEKYGKGGVDEANRRARAKGIESLLTMVHLQPGSIPEIDALSEEHNPKVIILDQIRNIGGGGDGLTARMNQNAIDVRGLLAKHQMVGVSTTQANAGDRPKVWLSDTDVDSSRTGLGAQADVLLGIGADEEMKVTGERAISICKNKASGNHEGFHVKFDAQRSQVK